MNTVCSEMHIDGNVWTPELVQTGLSCTLYNDGHPSAFYESVNHMSAEDFTETAHWLNERLKPENRTSFLGQLDEFPPELAGFVKRASTHDLLLNPILPSSLPLILSTVALIESDDASIYRSFQKAYQLTQARGRYAPSPELLDVTLDLTQLLKNMSNRERTVFIGMSLRLLDGLADHLEMQRAMTALSQDIVCRRGQHVVIDAPVDSALSKLLQRGNDPALFLSEIGTSLAPWETVCQPSPELVNTIHTEMMGYLADHYADAVLYAKFALDPEIKRLTQRLISVVSSEPTTNPQGILSVMRASGFIQSFMQAFAVPGPGTVWLSNMPSKAEMVKLVGVLSYDNVAGLSQLSPQGVRQTANIVNTLNIDTKLASEWQRILAKLGDKALPAMTDYVECGHLRELVNLIKTWIGEKGPRIAIPLTSEEMPHPPAVIPPSAAVDPHPENTRNLLKNCLQRRLGVAANYACLRKYSGITGVSFPYLESASFEKFLSHIDGSDPVFGLARASEAMGFLEDNSSLESFFSDFLVALRPYTMPLAHIVMTTAGGDNLPMPQLIDFAQTLAELRMPKAESNRLESLGYLNRDMTIADLPSDWKDYLTNTFTKQLSQSLFSSPATLHALIRGAALTLPVDMELLDDNGELSTRTYRMNTIEMIDTLVWEMQVNPFFGKGQHYILKNLVKQMRGLDSADSVVKWMDSSEKTLSRTIKLLSVVESHHSPNMTHLRNARVVLRALQDQMPPEVMLAAATLTNAVLPAELDEESQVALFLLLHRLGLFPAQVKWLQASKRFTSSASISSLQIDSASIQLMTRGMQEYLKETSEADLLKIGKLNLLTDGELLGAGMEIYVNAALRNRGEMLTWTSRMIADITVPVFTQIANRSSLGDMRAAMQETFPQAQAVASEMARRLLRDHSSHALKNVIGFAKVRADEAGGESQLARTELIQTMSTPAGREPLLPWIRSGALRNFVDWSSHIHADNLPVDPATGLSF